MKKLIAVVLMFVMASPAFADVFDGQAAYVGGTIVGVKEGTVGKLDTTNEKLLVFEHPGGKVTIPYEKIETWKYEEVLARHLGVIGTLVVVMVKHRQRRHFFQIEFKDDAGVTQSAVFEVAKEQPRVISAVLQGRVKSCRVTSVQMESTWDRGHATCDVPPPAKPNVVRSTAAHANTTETAQDRVTEAAKK